VGGVEPGLHPQTSKEVTQARRLPESRDVRPLGRPARSSFDDQEGIRHRRCRKSHREHGRSANASARAVPASEQANANG